MDLAAFQDYSYFNQILTDDKGNLIELPLRRGIKDGAFIDWITFTFRKETIELLKGICVTPTEYVTAASSIVAEIFGFGISEKMLGKGRYFYDSYYRLGIEKAEYGTLHFGGQRDTVLIEITGKGCMAAKPGWEKRLYTFLSQAIRPLITRIDVARDFFNGEYSPELARDDHDNGFFMVKNMTPKSECRGTAWRCEDYTGKTFNVGSKNSFKFVRIYEKGREQGDKNSIWTRFEVQWRKCKGQAIPLDVLLKPGEYLAGAYPLLNDRLFNSPISRIQTTEIIAKTTFEQKLEHGKNQVGRLVRFLKDLGWTAQQIEEALIADEGQYPKGLNPEEYDCQTIPKDIYIHEHNEQTIIQELDDIIQQMLVKPIELNQDIKNWLRFKLLHKHQYFNPLRQMQADKQEQQRLEAELERYLAYVWHKYSNYFYQSDSI